MRARILVPVIAVVAIVQVALVFGVWALLQPVPRPAPEAPVTTVAPSPAAERLTEALAAAAFRAVITADYASLSDVVRRAAGWPEIAFVSVEDSEGRILAHTDAARVGRTVKDAGPERAADGSPVTEFTAPMSASARAPGAPSPGRVRLGWRGETPGPALVPVAEPAVPSTWPLLAMLGAALALAVPVGLGAVKLAIREPESTGPAITDLRQIRTLKQAKWALARSLRELEAARQESSERGMEARRLRDDVVVRDEQLAQTRGEFQDRVIELEALRAGFGQEREQFAEELTRLSTQLMRANRDSESAEAQLTSMREDLGRVRGDLEQTRAALPSHEYVVPTGVALPREIVEDELKQLYARAVAYISYAVRGSLTNILGWARLLIREVDGPLTEGQRAGVLTIHDSGSRLLGLVNDLVDLARIDAKTLDLHTESVDVPSLVREVAQAGAERLRRKPEDIGVECPSTLPPVRGDRQRLRQILLTLLAELPGAGSVRMSVGILGEAIALRLEHPETALSEAALEELFDPFAPLDPSSPVHEDGGRLRLALARALTTLCGGTLSAESLPGSGVTFTLTLPTVS
jgi:signal transduction histidine kinase